jgi:hypothetical protein
VLFVLSKPIQTVYKEIRTLFIAFTLIQTVCKLVIGLQASVKWYKCFANDLKSLNQSLKMSLGDLLDIFLMFHTPTAIFQS